jgi:ABC-type glycerol-3-phosphate transport system permease component
MIRVNRLSIGKTIIVLFLAIYAAFSLMPFLWMGSTAFKTDDEIYVQQPRFLPEELRLDAILHVLTKTQIPRYFLNSLFVGLVQTVFEVLMAAMAGYAFARTEFRGRRVLFWIIIATMSIPWHVLLIPRFLIVRFFPLFGGNNLLGQGGSGMVDSIWALILPGLVSAFGVFLFRQFFMTLPKELEDAARIDGAGEFRIFWQVMLPLARPAVIVMSIFAFRESWNAFVWPLIVVRSNQGLRTIQIGLSYLRDDQGYDWPVLMAATLFATLPLIIIFIVLQRYFVQGIALTGSKG